MSKAILKSNAKRLSQDKLLQYDEVLRDQVQQGIIREINNSEANKRDVSYLPHSAVFRNSEGHSSKCRVVFLSNLKGDESKLSHNQISKPGANLNHRLLVAMILLRFDKYLVTFDLKKAFLQLLLSESDSEKLCFLWFRDVRAGDFSIVRYSIQRVPFGMRYSPFLLIPANTKHEFHMKFIWTVHQKSYEIHEKSSYEFPMKICKKGPYEFHMNFMMFSY